MSRTIDRVVTIAGASRRGAAALAVAAVLVSGCSVVSKINSIRHAVDGNKAVIQSFAHGLQDGNATPFEVTYVTSGSAPTTVTYAVQPPRDIAFKESASDSGSSDVNLIANTSGEYSCAQSAQSAQWSCLKLGTASAAAQNALFDIYTPAHWISFLDGFSIAAGIAGDKVTTSTMTVNGFNLKCVDFNAKGVQGTSTICSTDQGILGYVKIAQTSTTFEIKSYTATPPASDFQLPAGAKISSGSS